jgi:lysophospholipase L1-like esterase
MNNIKKLIAFVIFIVFIIFTNLKDIKEGLSSINKKNIILLGDSILNNSTYVKPGESVSDVIKRKGEINIMNVAIDKSKIKDINNQLIRIPSNYNNSNTYIFISIGGNDILNLLSQNDEQINELFKEYLKNIKAIKNKFPKSKIIALNIYHPPSSYYKMYYKSIDLWNKLLKENTFEGYNVLKIDEIIKTNNDLVNEIEPSKQGSIKIANAIVKF